MSLESSLSAKPVSISFRCACAGSGQGIALEIRPAYTAAVLYCGGGAAGWTDAQSQQLARQTASALARSVCSTPPEELHRAVCALLREALPDQDACRALALGRQGAALLGAVLTREGRSVCLHCGAGTILFQNQQEEFCKAAAFPVNRTRRLRDESLEGRLSVIRFCSPVRRILLLDHRLSAAYQNFQDGRAYGVRLPDSLEELAQREAETGCIQLLRAGPV